jgi:hypothetical protein
LKAQQGHYGIEVAADYALVHGRPDLHERLQKEQFASAMETRVIWHEGPSLDSSAVASGLALGCLAQDIKAFDLSRTLKARAPIKEIFPWGELGLATGLVGCMGVVLGAHAMKLDESYVGLHAQNSQHVCLGSADPGRLEKDKKAMEDKVAAVRNFTRSRIQWTTYLRDISERFPANAELDGFSGRNALDCSGSGKVASGAFDLRGTAPLSADGAIPQNIDVFLGELSKDPLWKRDFASMVTEIKLPAGARKDQPAGKKEQPKIDFSIVCVGRAPGEMGQAVGGGKVEKASKDQKAGTDKKGGDDKSGKKNETSPDDKKVGKEDANKDGKAGQEGKVAADEKDGKDAQAATEKKAGKEAK